MAKIALGRGLGALIQPRPPGAGGNSSAATALGVAAAEPAPGETVRKLPLDQIQSSPFQPRKDFKPESLHELVESIREQGIIQPLIVRKVDKHYELIAGERRWRAAKTLGLKDAPAILRDASDREVLELALIENLQRADLTVVEEARAYERLASEFNLRQEDIARKVGKSRASVANAMRLLDLDAQVQSWLTQERLSVGHAKVLLGVKSPEEQKLLAEVIIRQHSTVRAAEKLDRRTPRPSGHHARRSRQPRRGRRQGVGTPTGDAARHPEPPEPPARTPRHACRAPPRRQEGHHRNRLLRQRRPPAHPLGPGRERGDPRMTPRSKVVVPYGLSLRDTPDGVVISRRWFILATVPISVFTVAWDVSMFFFYRALFHASHPSWRWLLLFPTGHLALGLALTYGSLAMFLNRTELQISRSGVRVRRGPLPWLGNTSLTKREATTVSVVPVYADGIISSYRVVCTDRNQKKRVLLRELTNPEQADFVLATICQRLGLPGPMV